MNGKEAAEEGEAGKAGNAAALLENLRAANQLLGRQGVLLVLLCTVISALMYLSDVQWTENQELYAKITLLEKLRDAPDPSGFIDANGSELSSALYHEIDLDALYFKLALADYKDPTPVVDAISVLKERRRTLWGVSGQTFSLFGASIPIGSLGYLVPVILFILMHRFTATVYYRQAVRRQLAALEEWSEGPELFGFFPRSGTQPISEAYVRLFSNLMAAGFLLLPPITSFLFVFSSYSSRRDYDRAASDFMLTVNWVCLLLTVVDAALIAYQEKLLRFSAIVDQLLPGSMVSAQERSAPEAPGRSDSARRPAGWGKLLVFALPVVLVGMHLLTLGSPEPFYLGTIALMSGAFVVAWLGLRRRAGGRVARGFFFATVIAVLFWLSIPPLVWAGFLAYSHANPTEMAQLAWAIFAGAFVIGLVFSGLGRRGRES